MENILILGNGFNIDLGLKVDYIDYFKSLWYANLPIKLKESGLIKYIDINGVHKGNYNIEDLLKCYVHHLTTTNDATNDKYALHVLEKSFSCFVDKSEINFDENSCAFKVLSDFIEKREVAGSDSYWIYSFCYTNFDKIRLKFSENESLLQDIENFCHGNYRGNPMGTSTMFIDYIHGRSDNTKYSAILGLSEESFEGISSEIKESYDFIIKEKRSTYMGCKKEYLLKSLENSDVISFFGFSFSEPDIPYIQSWLKMPKSFYGKREIKLYLYNNDDIKTVLDRMHDIAKDNWDNFIHHYEIKKCPTQE